MVKHRSHVCGQEAEEVHEDPEPDDPGAGRDVAAAAGWGGGSGQYSQSQYRVSARGQNLEMIFTKTSYLHTVTNLTVTG